MTCKKLKQPSISGLLPLIWIFWLLLLKCSVASAMQWWTDKDKMGIFWFKDSTVCGSLNLGHKYLEIRSKWKIPKVNCYRIICRGEIQISTYNRGKAVGPVANKRCTVERSICLFFSCETETIQKNNKCWTRVLCHFYSPMNFVWNPSPKTEIQVYKSTGCPTKTFVSNLFEGESFALCSNLLWSPHWGVGTQCEAFTLNLPSNKFKAMFFWDSLYFCRPKFSLLTSHPCSNIMVV